MNKMILEKEEALKILKEEQAYCFNGSESEFEEYIKDCLPELCSKIGLPDIKNIIQQKQIKISNFNIRPDLIVVHEDLSKSIFEIKCTNKKHPATAPTEQCKAIGQLMLYQNSIEALTKEKPRMFLIDDKIHLRTVAVFKNSNLPITLIEVQNGRVFIPYVPINL
ncbi:hypothetical protein [Natroniella sp. ANB-PHB2]|uniref:hypothetical protein n=1 Tax=Natroniella sp. ANB-PHB2 TaxID=3384444 RepID=UPI0038D484AD